MRCLMHILFTDSNPASKLIAQMLIDRHGFRADGAGRWQKDGIALIDTKAASVLEVPTDFDDTLIVLSTHRSKVPGKMLTAHVPGNWGDADMGGEPKTLNTAPAILLKMILQELKKEGEKIDWPVSLEADHHGPLSKRPIVFVEIGNGEEQWEDKEAARAVANAVMNAIPRAAKEKPIIAFGVGGGHYPKTFTRLALETDIAVGHILPKYSIEALDESMFRQAIEKNVERVEKILIAKDETNLAQKEKINKLAALVGLPCELV
jgi:D-aminoacyl-tRNA deacylase